MYYLYILFILFSICNCQTTTFYSTSLISPPTKGIAIDFYLFNIDSINSDLTPKIVFKKSKQQIYGSKSADQNSTDGSVIYKFEIPRGCGEDIEFDISIGTNTYESSISYLPPTISSCSIVESNQNLVICNGDNFGSETPILNQPSQKTVIKFSDQIIETKTLNDTSLTFEIQDYYYSDYINIDVCNLSIANYLINIDPSFKSVSVPKPFHTNDPIVNVNGIHFTPTDSNVTLNCNTTGNENNQIKIKCTRETPIQFKCNIDYPKKFKSCSILFNNNIEEVFSIDYSIPIILETNSVSSRDGGILTLSGTDFHEPIQNISVGLIQCINAKMVNKTMITCELPPNPQSDSINFANYTQITVLSDGLVGIYEKFFFSEYNQISEPRYNHDEDKKLKWLVPVIVIPVFFGISTIFIPFIFCRKNSRMNKLNNCLMGKNKDSRRKRNGIVSSKLPTKSISDINLHSMHIRSLED